jgi:hypothetical protein
MSTPSNKRRGRPLKQAPTMKQILLAKEPLQLRSREKRVDYSQPTLDPTDGEKRTVPWTDTRKKKRQALSTNSDISSDPLFQSPSTTASDAPNLSSSHKLPPTLDSAKQSNMLATRPKQSSLLACLRSEPASELSTVLISDGCKQEKVLAHP